MLFIFDENFPENLSKGLHTLEGGNTRSPIRVEVRHAIDVMGGRGASDEALIPKVGELNAVLVTQDKDFKNKKHYFSLYREHNIGVIVYLIPSKEVYWDKVKSFIRNWESIKEKVNGAEIPFAFIIKKDGGVMEFDF